MRWLAEVLERNGIVPSAHIVEQAREALPRVLIRDVVRETASAVLHARSIRDHAGDFARDLATKCSHAIELALEQGDELGDDEADAQVVDVEELTQP